MNTPTDKEIRDWYMGYGVEGRAELAEVEGKAFDRYLLERDAKVGNEGYREGIAWEQKRWEILLHVEYDCKCVTPLDHLRTRLERSENGIDYDREFDDTIGDIE